MEKKSLTRWILTNKEGVLELKEKEVSRYMPINRMISEVGFYPFDFIEAKDHVYYYTFHEHEKDTYKSEIMVGRFNTDTNQMDPVDMSEDDYEYLDIFKKILNLKDPN